MGEETTEVRSNMPVARDLDDINPLASRDGDEGLVIASDEHDSDGPRPEQADDERVNERPVIVRPLQLLDFRLLAIREILDSGASRRRGT